MFIGQGQREIRKKKSQNVNASYLLQNKLKKAYDYC